MRDKDWLARQLPVAMTEDDFLMRFLQIFQRMSDSVLDQIDTLEHAFDPTVAPTPMVRAMAEWIGVDWVDSSLEPRLQRQIVMEYSELLQWRGTKRGVIKLLELLGGGEVRVIDSGGVFGVGQARVNATGGADAAGGRGVVAHVRLDMETAGWNRIDDLIRIVRAELPASLTFDLWVADVKVWPAADAEDAALVRSGGHLPEMAATRTVENSTEGETDA